MGCTRFTEHWDKSADDLLVDAAQETFASAGVDKDTVDAYWLGTAQSGMSGITLARPLQLEGKPVTRVENYCATGSEALRGGVLRRCEWRLRHGHGDRRGEGEGLGLSGPERVPDPERRHGAHA